MLLLKQKIQFKLCQTITYRGSGQPECVRQAKKYFSLHSATVQAFQMNIHMTEQHNLTRCSQYMQISFLSSKLSWYIWRFRFLPSKILKITYKGVNDFINQGWWWWQYSDQNDCHKRILSSDSLKPGILEIFQSLYDYKNCFALWEF